MDWRSAVLAALDRYRARHGSTFVERQSLLSEELENIARDTGSAGSTPDQTLSRVLQELRDEGILEFLNDAGPYRVVEDTGRLVWELDPGTPLLRSSLHDRYGGARKGGIAPSRRTPNILIFTDPTTEAQHGYFDHWEGEVFHYCGEDHAGARQLILGNRAIYDHREDGRALRFFDGSGEEVTYLGEFELDSTQPYYEKEAPQTGGGGMSNVIMFRLRPRGAFHAGGVTFSKSADVSPTLSSPYRQANEKPESSLPVPFQVDPNALDRGLAAHAETQNALAEWAADNRFKPISPGLGDPDFDIGWWDGDTFVVAEVKSLTSHNEARQLRLGLGQILDYADIVARSKAKARPVLTVEREPSDRRWVDLCRNHGVTLVWPGSLDGLR